MRERLERSKNNKTEIVVQRGNQEGKEYYEFPGSLIKEFESFFDALKHGIKEETGLDIIEITGQENNIISDNNSDFTVECFRPYSVYQTVKGAFYSMGAHFKCKAEGELLSEGCAGKNIELISLDELEDLVADKLFSNIDEGAAMLYLLEKSDTYLE